MITEQQKNLGYDEYGNNHLLICENDKKALDLGTWVRSDHNMICAACRLRYGAHPQVQGALWLHRLCGNRLVKL